MQRKVELFAAVSLKNLVVINCAVDPALLHTYIFEQATPAGPVGTMPIMLITSRYISVFHSVI